MDRQATIKETIESISKLPDWRIKEVSDYVDFLLKKSEDKDLGGRNQKYYFTIKIL